MKRVEKERLERQYRLHQVRIERMACEGPDRLHPYDAVKKSVSASEKGHGACPDLAERGSTSLWNSFWPEIPGNSRTA